MTYRRLTRFGFSSIFGRLMADAEIATHTDAYRIQSYITHILIPLDSTEEQLNLYHAGVLPFLVKLVVSNQQVLQIPALRCLSSICFSNKMISDVVCNIR